MYWNHPLDYIISCSHVAGVLESYLAYSFVDMVCRGRPQGKGRGVA